MALIGAGVLPPVGAAPARAEQAATALDAIFVTAQRRKESLQHVPISIASFAGDELERRRIRTLESLNGYAAGFVSTRSVSYGAAPLTIRGIGGANGGGNFFNDEPVAVYVDGVYVSRLSISTAALVDIADIQVLRGPQGTLYGRNSTAGAVLISTRSPSDELEGEMRASAASFGDYRVSGALSIPVTEKRSARAAFGYSNQEGWGENTVAGERIGGGEDVSARLSLRHRPTERITTNLIGEYQRRTANPALIAMTDVGQTGAASPFVLRSDLDEVLKSRRFELNDPNLTESRTFSVTATTEIDLGFATLGVIGGYRDWALDGVQDSDSTALRLFTNGGAIGARQFSAETRVASDSDGALSWLVGGYFLNDRTDVDFAINNYQGLFGLGTNAFFDAGQKNNAYALFADFSFDLTSRIAITAGARYSYETKHFKNDLVVSILNGGSAPPSFMGGASFSPGDIISDPPRFSDSASFADVTPRFVVEFNPYDDFLLYAGYSRGFKSGGFNSFSLSPAFDSEVVNTFEAGFKSEFAGRRLRLNASGFIYDYSDLQIRLPVPTGGVDIRNVAESTIKGLELEASVSVLTGLTATANLSLLSTEISRGVIPSISSASPPFPIGAPLPLIDEDVSGNHLTRAPRAQFFAAVDYARRFGSLTGRLNASIRHQGGVFFLETNQDAPTFRNSAWTEIDLRGSISKESGKWEVSIFMENLTDNRHVSAVTALGGFPNAAINEPRRFGIEGSVRF